MHDTSQASQGLSLTSDREATTTALATTRLFTDGQRKLRTDNDDTEGCCQSEGVKTTGDDHLGRAGLAWHGMAEAGDDYSV